MDIGKSYKNVKAEVKTSLGKILVRFLEQLLNNKDYEMFYEIINEMLNTHCKLEQEAFI